MQRSDRIACARVHWWTPCLSASYAHALPHMTLQVHAFESRLGHMMSFGQQNEVEVIMCQCWAQASRCLACLLLHFYASAIAMSKTCQRRPDGPRRKIRDSWRTEPVHQSPARTSQPPADPRWVSHEHCCFKPLRFGVVYYVAKADLSFLWLNPNTGPL